MSSDNLNIDLQNPEDEPVLFKTKIFDIVEKYQKGRSGKMLKRFIVRHPGAVAILPILPDGRIILIKQYRIAVGQYLYEIPAGTREPHEEPLVTAKRELIEETGFHAGSVDLLTTFFTSPGIFREKLYLYLATNLTPGQAALEDGEDLTLHFFNRDEIKKMILRGEIKDGKTLLALLWDIEPFLKK
ncbi:MAG: NUDIX hydrolase [Planctomycetia bacterium]|nr:NUDIX hydrolase [Planctomycetia bacterium]